MLSFECDYTAGAHPKVLARLAETNLEPLPGYGADKYCESAKEKIKAAFACPQADVHFLVGGTQTNSIIIAALLHDCEGVISAETGHIGVHEAGAVEYTGHKVLTIPAHEGKIDVHKLCAYLARFYADESNSHMVQPGMVYISHPTEYGTLYTKTELEAIYATCREYSLPLFIDGARLGYGIASRETDVTLPDIARLCDVFYIGGTKVGALCGEAVVFTKNNTPKYFTTLVKQHGALLAKGRLLGVQFDTLFTDDLYFEISRHAIEMAEKLKALLREKGYRFHLESPTNQQFVVLENTRMAELAKKVRFCFWEQVDAEHTAVRFATSWSTTEEEIAQLAKIL
ncbi:MAG: aminotransferase class I/II-fold pyridoxal phosphate-dependent enzyme [Clostridia bacterium]|nr:aminotransferase class I/II-fold pyridoxal phosphate-dependent enzyme [Clostridia bacterium]